MSVNFALQTYSLLHLPNTVLAQIGAKSSLFAISSLSQTCRKLNTLLKEDGFWDLIATAIHCPINPNGASSALQVRNYVKIVCDDTDELFGGQSTSQCCFLGMKCVLQLCYFNRQGPKAQSRDAVNWYREESGLGDLDAQATLGFLHGEGIGVKRDIPKMISLYQDAADRGCAQAQFELGNCYRFGRGVSQDKALALIWYGKAIQQGHSKAEFAMWNYYTIGKDLDMDAQVYSWFRKGAEFKKATN